MTYCFSHFAFIHFCMCDISPFPVFYFVFIWFCPCDKKLCISYLAFISFYIRIFNICNICNRIFTDGFLTRGSIELLWHLWVTSAKCWHSMKAPIIPSSQIGLCHPPPWPHDPGNNTDCKHGWKNWEPRIPVPGPYSAETRKANENSVRFGKFRK